MNLIRFALLYLGGQKRNRNRIKTTYVYYYYYYYCKNNYKNDEIYKH